MAHVQIWDLSTALDQHQARCGLVGQSFGPGAGGAQTVQVGADAKQGGPAPNLVSSAAGLINVLPGALAGQGGSARCFGALQGPTAEELLGLIESCDLAVNSLNSSPCPSSADLAGLDRPAGH